MEELLSGSHSLDDANNDTGDDCRSSWPLHKISDPHERNDAILKLPPFQHNDHQNIISESSSGSNGSSWKGAWRSSNIVLQPNSSPQHVDGDASDDGDDDGNDDDSGLVHQGNQRFYELLFSYLEEYAAKSRLEKPLVALKILKEWRNQTPPGRFLVTENDTHPHRPLWKDVGDKKAREKISKALKNLVLQNSISAETSTTTAQGQPAQQQEVATLHRRQSDHQGDEKCCYKTNDQNKDTPAMLKLDLSVKEDEEEEKAAPEQKPNQFPTRERNNQNRIPPPNRPVAIPRFQKLDKNTRRRVSEQLHLAEEDGRIYGRWEEREMLVRICEHQRQQHAIYLKEGESSCLVDLILISGEMGIGKTSLARTLKNPLILDGDEQDSSSINNHGRISTKQLEPPFFLQVQFKQRKWTDANAVFVALINDFCQQVLKRQDPHLRRRYRDAIDQALGEDITLLTHLVPGLDVLWNDSELLDMVDDVRITRSKGWEQRRQSSSSHFSSSTGSSSQQDSYGCMAMQRVKQVFGVFFRTIATASPQHSLIVLLDSLQYASETELDIWSSLVADKSHCGILFLGTYRDKEITPHFKREHIRRGLQQLKANHKVNVTEIHLENLPEDGVHFMLAETLSLQEEETKSLNKLVFSVTKGNPSFIKELLRDFQDKGLLYYDETSMQWTCSVQEIPLTIDKINGVSDLYQAKVLALPPEVQETLKIAACLWSIRVDESVLKMVDTSGAATSHIMHADVRGLVSYRDESYSFVSDGVREAIYNLIPRDERSSYHLGIAQRLWLNLQENQNPGFYATLMSQLFVSDHLVEQEDDRRALAALYLDAGQKAAKYLGFHTAWYCLSHGISMVTSLKTWGRDNYDLSLSLYNTAIEVCYCNAEFTELDKLIHEVLDNARTFEDSLLARSTLVYALGSRNKQFEAIESALETLRKLGETRLSLYPSKFRVLTEARRIKRLLRTFSDEAILRLPRMKDPKKLAMMQILNHVLLYTLYVAPKLAFLVCLKLVEITVKYGLTGRSLITKKICTDVIP
jgi:predicted ATPase